MKRLTFLFLAVIALGGPAMAGTEIYSNENTQSVAPECPQWDAANEINLTLSGGYETAANSWQDDLYLGIDQVWGGAIDLKYFMHRYSGFGGQGTLLASTARLAPVEERLLFCPS